MKKIIFSLILALVAIGWCGCATLANLRAEKEARAIKAERLKWWNEMLQGGVLDVGEDYSLGDMPRSRVKTSNGAELVFH